MNATHGSKFQSKPLDYLQYPLELVQDNGLTTGHLHSVRQCMALVLIPPFAAPPARRRNSGENKPCLLHSTQHG